MNIIELTPKKYNCQMCDKHDYMESHCGVLLCSSCYIATGIECAWCHLRFPLRLTNTRFNFKKNTIEILCYHCCYYKIQCNYCYKIIKKNMLKTHEKSKRCQDKKFFKYFDLVYAQLPYPNPSYDDCMICLEKNIVFKLKCQTCKVLMCTVCANEYIKSYGIKCCICKINL